MSFNISYTFEALDKFTAVSNKISSQVNKLSSKINLLRDRFNRAGRSMSDLGRKMALSVTAPLVGIGVAALKSSDDLERLRFQLSTLGGSAKEANKFYKQLVDFTVKSPFGLDQVSKAADTLRIMGNNSQETFRQLKIIGNIAAATGADMGMLSEMFGRAKSSSRGLSLMFTTLGGLGVDLRKKMQDMFAAMGHGGLDIDKLISKGAIGFPVMIKALEEMTTKTGIFAGQMNKYASTLGALLGSLKNAIKFYLLAPIGDVIDKTLGLSDKLKRMISYLLNNQNKIKLFIEAHKQTIKLVAAFAALTAVIAPLLIMLGLFVMTVGALFSPWTLVIGAVAAYLGYMAKAYLKTHTFQQLIGLIINKFKQYFNVIKNFIAAHQKLLHVLVKVTVAFMAIVAASKMLSIAIGVINGIAAALKAVAVIAAVIGSPFTLAIAIIVGLGAVVYGLYKKFALVRKIVKEIGHIFMIVIKGIGKTLYDIFIKPFMEAYHIVNKIAGLFRKKASTIQVQHQMITPPNVGRVQPQNVMVSAQPQKVRSEVYVNLSDPGKIVKSWSGKSDGMMNFDVGTNMAMSRY